MRIVTRKTRIAKCSYPALSSTPIPDLRFTIYYYAHAIQTIWTNRLAGKRDWLRHVGHGWLVWLRRSRVASVSADGGRPWLHFFRHRLRLWRGSQCKTSWPNLTRESGQAPLQCDK